MNNERNKRGSGVCTNSVFCLTTTCFMTEHFPMTINHIVSMAESVSKVIVLTELKSLEFVLLLS